MPKSTPVKLTLRLESDLIAEAKEYAAANGTSLSRIVAGHFSNLVSASRAGCSDGAFTARLRHRQPERQPNMEDYWADLTQKHGSLTGK